MGEPGEAAGSSAGHRTLSGAAAPVRFSESRFRHPWREYQARILADFERHAADGHFHVVAAPGSGKTVLGLEVVRRVGRPALVCAPTVALRAQWVERLTAQFLDGARPEWISEDVRAPAWLTFSTYQALHASHSRDGVAALARRLRRAGVGTLVLDEAHHLKQEWWRTLDALQRALRGSFVVALTGTPPYDVPQAEWNRYLGLAGPIDAEVSAPELVRAGDLCPHQDYVYVQRPTEREQARVRAFDEHVRTLLLDLALDQDLAAAVRAHPSVVEPEARIDALLARPEYALSLAVFLKHASGVVPEGFLGALGVDRRALPAFDRAWAEHLLAGVLFHDAASFPGNAGHRAALEARLQQMGALERRGVFLLASPRLARRLRQSPAKLRAVAEIAEVEARALGDELRLLVLTERIREQRWVDELPEPAQRVGVVPIFDTLRRLRLPHVRPCAASGRLGIVPRALAPDVERALGRGAAGTPLAHDPEYVQFSFTDGEQPAAFVRQVGGDFASGRVTALVGTTALLGEGWDAPAVNTVVLATAIGSYVSTNQSRGRALRRDAERPHKAANIWHPVCVDPRLACETGEMALLRRRFAAFMGAALDRPIVESGLRRLGVPDRLSPEAADALNAAMCRHAEDRAGMAELWRRALLPGPRAAGRPVRETIVDRRRPRSTVVPWLRAPGRLGAWLERLRARRLGRRLTLALVSALRETGAIDAAEPATVSVDVVEGRLRIRASGLSVRDETVLHDALRQLFCPLFSPRYLLRCRRHTWVVPKPLADDRESASVLLRHFRKRVGRAQLVYTRTAPGRRLLLAAVERHLASHLLERPETATRWL